MDSLRIDPSSRPASVPTTSESSAPSAPTNDDIEAIIQMATSSRPSLDGRSGPLRDTRTQLFVGNLPYRVRWQDLKDLFRKAGTVLRADVSLGPDNRSRGYGTVLLATAEDAGRAVDMFNGYSWQTRTLEVRPDRLPPDFDNPLANVPGPSTGFSLGTSSSLPAATNLYGIPHLAGNPSNAFATASSNTLEDFDFIGYERPGSSSGGGRNLFVGNLPFHCQWQDLKDLFRQAGTIFRADVALGQDGRSRGFGTVVFATDLDAERAVKMFNGYEYNGRALKVHYDKFSLSSQSLTKPASPMLSAFAGATTHSGSHHSQYPLQQQHPSSQHPMQLQLPLGYSLDFGPPTGPSSPFDMQVSMQYLSSQVQESTSPLQPSQKRGHLPHDSSYDSDSLTFTTPKTITQSSERPRSPAPPSYLQSQNHTQSHHPHHPGPISLPPPPSVAAFPLPPPHTLSPHFMSASMSPLHHPLSPIHHPSHSHASQVPVTPHGLPPITPSMPPFNFLPQHHHFSHNGNNSTASSPNSAYMHPVPSPPPLPSPTFPPHTQSQYVLATFSPGVAMSPGAFWGRPGGAAPNPFINPAVGAPVHPHSPRDGFFATSGIGFPSSPGSSGMGTVEMSGYFDNAGYFPPVAGPLSGSGLANEIMKEGVSEKGKQMDRENIMDDSMFKAAVLSPGEEPQVRRSSSGDTSWSAEDSIDLKYKDKYQGEAGHIHSRTHSLSSKRSSNSGLPLAHRPDSDPVPALPSTVPY